jgi:YggT family protein
VGGLDVDPRVLILFAVSAYRTLLFAFIIMNILQALAGLRIPEGIRPAANFIYDACEPFLRIFRGMLPAVRMGGMGLDLSPLIAFLALFILEGILRSVLF